LVQFRGEGLALDLQRERGEVIRSPPGGNFFTSLLNLEVKILPWRRVKVLRYSNREGGDLIDPPRERNIFSMNLKVLVLQE